MSVCIGEGSREHAFMYVGVSIFTCVTLFKTPLTKEGRLFVPFIMDFGLISCLFWNIT